MSGAASMRSDGHGMDIPRNTLVLGRRIGNGSFGVVYEAEYMNHSTVAVKVLTALSMTSAASTDALRAEIDKFMREATLHAQIQDPAKCLLQLHGIVRPDADNPPWMVLEYCAHGNLASLRARRQSAGQGPLPLPVSLSVMHQARKLNGIHFMGFTCLLSFFLLRVICILHGIYKKL